MNSSAFQGYSTKHVHFYDEELPVLLQSGLALTRESTKKPRIVDLGCGDGRLILALHKKRLLQDAGEVFGVDVSTARIERLAKELPFVKCIVSDALDVKMLSRASFDYVICSQVIEHVTDDERLMLEIKRLLKDGGLAYISSVVKKWYGAYLYFRDGSFRLDPTHVREYSSADELVSLIASKGFEVTDVRTGQITYPVLDLFIRLLVKVSLVNVDSKFYERHKVLVKTRQFGIPLFGYSSIEILAKKNA